MQITNSNDMKTLLLTLTLFGFGNLLAQAPTIAGDTMLCPNTNGTASVTNALIYDSYTWYTKYWFDENPFVAVPGVTGPSFTYDWYTYDQSLIKLVVTLDGNTYESNTIQVDSYAWTGLVVANEDTENVEYNPDADSWLLCPGTTFYLEIFSPYTASIQWYKDDVAIPGANQMVYTISEAGLYHVVAAPQFCPNATSTSLPFNVVIISDCNLGVANRAAAAPVLYPNPVNDMLTIGTSQRPDTIVIYTITGQRVLTAANTNTINVAGLPKGVYIIETTVDSRIGTQKFVKQ